MPESSGKTAITRNKSEISKTRFSSKEIKKLLNTVHKPYRRVCLNVPVSCKLRSVPVVFSEYCYRGEFSFRKSSKLFSFIN